MANRLTGYLCAASAFLLVAGCSSYGKLDLPMYHAGKGRGVQSIAEYERQVGPKGTSFVELGGDVSITAVDGQPVRIGYPFYFSHYSDTSRLWPRGPVPFKRKSYEDVYEFDVFDYDSLLLPAGRHELVVKRQLVLLDESNGRYAMHGSGEIAVSVDTDPAYQYVVSIISGTLISNGVEDMQVVISQTNKRADYGGAGGSRAWDPEIIVASTDPRLVGTHYDNIWGSYYRKRE